jgi:Zn-dependent M28 family amino/carboxypeptidase
MPDMSRQAIPVHRAVRVLIRAAVLGLLLGLTMAACSREVPEFDADRAFADLVRQTEFGPRVPGTEAHRACARWLTAQLDSLADTVWQQSFSAYVPLVMDSLSFTNIIGRFAPEKKGRVLLGAHWDTRPFADQDPDSADRTRSFDGASDGASGVAVLLEIARALKAQPPPIGVDIVFFDGEDLGRTSADHEWCLGSRYFAQRLPVKYDWAIIADLVGDKDLTLYREGYSYRSARALQDRIWNKARELGETAFREEVEFDITDDHVPFLMRGIPAVDIIDLRYQYWHTSEDTPANCSPASLRTVGRVMLHVLYDG